MRWKSIKIKSAAGWRRSETFVMCFFSTPVRCVGRRNQIIRDSRAALLCIYVGNGAGNMTQSHLYLTALT